MQRNVLSSGLEVLGIDGPSSHPHLRPRGKCLALISRCYAPSILLSPANGPNSGLTRCGGVELLATSNTHPCFSELARARPFASRPSCRDADVIIWLHPQRLTRARR